MLVVFPHRVFHWAGSAQLVAWHNISALQSTRELHIFRCRQGSVTCPVTCCGCDQYLAAVLPSLSRHDVYHGTEWQCDSVTVWGWSVWCHHVDLLSVAARPRLIPLCEGDGGPGGGRPDTTGAACALCSPPLSTTTAASPACRHFLQDPPSLQWCTCSQRTKLWNAEWLVQASCRTWRRADMEKFAGRGRQKTDCRLQTSARDYVTPGTSQGTITRTGTFTNKDHRVWW